MIKLKSLLENDYVGMHSAPLNDGMSSMDNLKDIYPDDIYSHTAVHLYGTHDEGVSDSLSIGIIQSARNKPNKQIKIYRAVPYIKTNNEKILDLEKQLKYIQKYGKIPNGVNTTLHRSDYYEKVSDEIEKLKNSISDDIKKIGINNGDWVTINKAYAIFHGKTNLNGNYKILSKTVSAKTLFTDGNSIHEWGYNKND